MTQSPQTILKPGEIVKTLRKHAALWIVPAVTLTLIALVYGLLKPPVWEAQLALLLRDEAVGDVKRHGRFDNLDAMKTAQKTILEIVRSQSVVVAALTEIGQPDAPHSPHNPPSVDEVDRCRKKITIKPPKGAEFGSTEVIYLAVQAGSRERALQLVDAVYRQLDRHLQSLRRAKAQTIFAELENAVHLAEGDLSAATRRLETVEIEVGSDLSELRNLNDAATGGGKLRNALALVETELRTVRTSYQSNQRLQEHLQTAQRDPNQLVAMPNDLLLSQPALRRLKEGLIDAQLLTAQRLGKMSPLHPSVQEAVEAEEEIRRHLHGELEVAVRGLQAELRMNQSRIGDVERQKRQLELKLQKIATLRARYDNLVTAVQRRSQILEQAQQDLAEARASQAAAQAASLISRWAEPETGDRPVGPGVALITLSGLVGGLVIGLGLVLLTAPLEQLTGRRWSDHIFGRRRSDQMPEGDRRATEIPAPRETQTDDRRADDPPAEVIEQPVTVRSLAIPPRRGDQWRMPGSLAQTANVDPGTSKARWRSLAQ